MKNVGKRDPNSLKFQMNESTDFNVLNLEDFIEPRSGFMFELFKVSPDFLDSDATTWNYIPSYKKLKTLIEQTITVINDGSERILGRADKVIRAQKARKEKNFKDLVFSRFDKNTR